MSSNDDRSQIEIEKRNSVPFNDKVCSTDSDIVQQLRQRIGRTPVPPTRTSRVKRNSTSYDSTAYQSVLKRLAEISSGAELELTDGTLPNEVYSTTVAQNLIARRDGESEFPQLDANHRGKIAHLQTVLNDTRELAANLQTQIQSLETESSILVSRLGAENDARLYAEIEASQLAAEINGFRDDTQQLVAAWEQAQDEGRQHVDSIRRENARLQLALEDRSQRLAEIQKEYERRSSEAARREAQHVELQRALERRLERIGSQLQSERAASECVGQEMQQLTAEYSRQMSQLAQERNQLRTQFDELHKRHELTQVKCTELESKITATTKAQRETCRQNDARAMQIERLKVMLNETIAAEEDAKKQRAGELSQMAQSKARWKLLLTQARQKHREYQDKAQELIAKSAEEQSRRERAESNVARCQVTIELLDNRIKSLKTLMQREVAVVRKREAALKRVVQDRSGQIDAQEVLSKVETDERVRRLTHELILTRRLVLGLQQKCIELDSDKTPHSNSAEHASSKAA